MVRCLSETKYTMTMSPLCHSLLSLCLAKESDKIVDSFSFFGVKEGKSSGQSGHWLSLFATSPLVVSFKYP